MTPPTDDVLRLARELLEASERATPGPWMVESRPDKTERFLIRGNKVVNRNGSKRRVCAIGSPLVYNAAELQAEYACNAAFIALARTHAPALCRRVEADAKVIEAARKGADIISGLEAVLDEAGLGGQYDVREARAWWNDMDAALRARDEALAKGEG